MDESKPKRRSFLSTFGSEHPVLAMLHLKGETAAERLDRARREIDLLWDNGVDAVVVENYFGEIDDMVAVCEYLRSQRPEIVFGVNALHDDARGFELAESYGARFLQLDSVCGHLPPAQDEEFAAWITERRAESSTYVLGGVRFKYQPYRSGRSLEEDLRLGIERCDAIVVTGDGTGIPTPVEKLNSFREVIGVQTPLVVGAGVTSSSVPEQLAVADAVIVGSALKDTLVDTGDVSGEHTCAFVSAVRRLDPNANGPVTHAELATLDNFGPFGRLVPLDRTVSPDVVVTDGDGWNDVYSREPIVDTVPSLGRTTGGGSPWTVRQMERHHQTTEAAVCLTQDMVLAVAAADVDAPSAEDVRAFVIPKGIAALLHRGVWHDACHGVDGPVDYLWLADCSVIGTEGWVPISGSPVRVSLARTPQAEPMTNES